MFLRLFPLWALLLAALALLEPPLFLPWTGAIVPLLGLVMFMMGLTLRGADFLRVWQHPKYVLLALAVQFTVMPAAAWIVSAMLALPPELMVGMVLVGACPGGTASNVICYLSRGNVALSITLTACATLAAVVLTPLLTWWWVGQRVEVPVLEMLWSICQIILLPVLAGVGVRAWLYPYVDRVAPAFPHIAMVSIVLIIAIIIAANAHTIDDVLAVLLVAVALHNAAGLAVGYAIPRTLGWDVSVCRTIGIEVGMQNSGLGVALASQYFSALAALPGALFSVWHNITGSFLAAVWSRGAVKRQN